ncbi:hypothetical protein BBAD15_g10076 [Beauveria bassiana D1-5]|uniref:Protein kinase domain-containing protein n=1 Tax=Beauveria bassiana D1-5 TaxID=1245745 RepID=A0A0A2VF16_BEABA|nr:hypothetical protein BBAD15_g10076 [Beauveria bassiana D1-5]
MSKRIRELERQLQQAKAREEEAKAREENERREKEKEKLKNQKTTLAEYLHNCHFDIYQKLRLAGASESSTGLATSVDGKYYPKWLRPWTDFSANHRLEHFNDIIRVCGEGRVFHQKSTTVDIGMSFERKEAGYENAIDHFEKTAVEDPTWNILEPIWADEELCQRYQATGITFVNGIRAFNEVSEDIGADVKRERGKQRPDGACTRTGLDGTKSVAFVYDYKAAHKFSVEHVEAALSQETLFTDVHEWFQTNRYATDSAIRGEEREKARIAMALIQVFNYMRSYGVPYGLVTAGKSSVFLHYDRAEPLVLRQHLCVPAKEVTQETIEISTSRVSHTLVAELASFCLLSLSQQALTGRQLEAALNQTARHLKTWKKTDYKDPATSPESDDKDSPSASPPQDADESFDCDESPAKSSYTLRPRACKDAAILPKRREDDEHGGDEGSRSRTTARDSNRSKASVGKGKNDGRKGSASAPTRQYCTQACLLGLKSGHELDKNCPNVRSHNVKGGTKHLINVTSLVHLMAGQLRRDPYECCHALDGLGKRGSTGVLFRLEMAPLGYTFVGKGTVNEHLSILKHECKIYQRLSGLQGEVVPVHLGIVSFARGYILTGGDRVVHMMLMSWGGLLAKEAVPSYLNLKEEVRRSSQAVYRNGVDHGDERAPNLLWNAERRRVMVIDFDRAALLPEPQNKLLASLSTAGRKRKGHEARDDSGKRSLSRGLIQSVR